MARTERRGGRLRTLVSASAVMGLAAWLFTTASHSSEPAPAATTGGHAPPSPAALGDGFEPSDVTTRSVAIVMVIGVAVIALSITGLVVMIRFMTARDQSGPPLTPQQTAVITPPGPPLQSEPLTDIATLREHENATLAAYRWLGPDHAAAQIPIGRAMALVVGRPLDPVPAHDATQPGANP